MASAKINSFHNAFKKADARAARNAKATEYFEDRGIDLEYLEKDVGLYIDRKEHRPIIPFTLPSGKLLTVNGSDVPFAIKREWNVPKTGPNKGRKFSQPKGVHSPLYFAPIPKRFRRPPDKLVNDTEAPLVVTEGAVKAMAIAQNGGFAVAVLGCQNWQSDGVPVPEWDLIALKGRDVTIVYDADTETNTNVQDGLLGVRDMLTERGAEVYICLLEPVEGDTKTGADDWIKAHGYKAFQKFVKENRRARDDPAFAEWGSVAQLDFMNAKHAVVMSGSQARILHEDTSPLILSKRKDLADLYANRFAGDAPLVDWWMQHAKRRTYERIVFDPTGSAPHTDYNLWNGFAVEPKKGKCDLFLKHIRENIAQGDKKTYDYLLAWMADAVQNPAKRPGVAIALRGAQGTGKGVFATQFGSLFSRPHFVHLQSMRQLTGRFNSHMEGALVVFADEALWAGNHSAIGPLRALITEDQIQVERKGVDLQPIRNFVRLIVASNEDWVVPAGEMERRFCVLDVGTKRMQDHAYFKAVIEQMNNGGREALLHFLQNYDLSEANVRAFPKSAALWDQKVSSMPRTHQFWYEVLQRGAIKSKHEKIGNEYVASLEWEREVSKETIHTIYREWLGNGDRSHASATAFGKAIRKMCPGVSSAKVYAGKKKKRVVRDRVYRFPPLEECRRQFAAAWGQDVEWEE